MRFASNALDLETLAREQNEVWLRIDGHSGAIVFTHHWMDKERI